MHSHKKTVKDTTNLTANAPSLRWGQNHKTGDICAPKTPVLIAALRFPPAIEASPAERRQDRSLLRALFYVRLHCLLG